MPPLSWTLRDSPEAASEPRLGLAPAVLLPESFRGGCSFGAALVARPLPRACNQRLSCSTIRPLRQPVPNKTPDKRLTRLSRVTVKPRQADLDALIATTDR